ncbi:hypothetical protein SAMN04489712_104258 [Thermomonospora echinospora]|uniref:Uncharacterized protein n=1 Tax=Thermomonospora echinospora TaxID=1992 RepID=A0A1H5YYB6_9ACTN|nr:hypothetical protein [Thermomonospora echinospora]SEG29223.1 hypothetical protein SAMN04489712_104258 [Thermomonospora echinospora]
MRCRLRHRRDAVDPLSRLPAARVAPDPAFRAALRERLVSTAPCRSPGGPVRAPERRRRAFRRPGVFGGLMIAVVLLCAHLAACG